MPTRYCYGVGRGHGHDLEHEAGETHDPLPTPRRRGRLTHIKSRNHFSAVCSRGEVPGSDHYMYSLGSYNDQHALTNPGRQAQLRSLLTFGLHGGGFSPYWSLKIYRTLVQPIYEYMTILLSNPLEVQKAA